MSVLLEYIDLINIFNQTLPIMLALCLMLLGTYYAQNYAGIIGWSLDITRAEPTYSYVHPRNQLENQLSLSHAILVSAVFGFPFVSVSEKPYTDASTDASLLYISDLSSTCYTNSSTLLKYEY